MKENGFINLFDSTKLHVLTIIVIAVYISIYITLGFCAQPSADDFDFAYKVYHSGFLDSQYSWYNTWTGRYASTAAISAFVACFDFMKYYWLIPSFLIPATFASFYLFVYIAGMGLVTNKQAAFAGVILLSLYLSEVPTPAETFYWLAGGFTYQLGNILYLVSLAVLIRIVTDPAKSKLPCIMLICLLVTGISGFNETIMLLQTFVLAGVTLLACKIKHPKWALSLFLFFLSLLGVAVVAAAPGNSLRSQYFPLAHHFGPSLIQSIKFGFTDIAHWAKSFPLWAASFILIPDVAERVTEYRLLHNQNNRPKLLIVPSIWLCLMIILYFPAFWSMGQAPPPRTLSIAYMIFILGWFPSLTALYVAMKMVPVRLSPAVFKATTLLFMISLFLVDNGSLAVYDLPKSFAYRDAIQSRYDLINSSKKRNDQITDVPFLPYIPETLYVSDISGDINNWINRSYAEFFNIKAIRKRYDLPHGN
ncbi:MAG TPA: DUF6056 family protein [Dongiaceae bacterium]|nr:DUF6056 family protein [Dongiaceae bacterium]